MKLKISTSEQLTTHFKSLRKAKGLSQADVGKKIGLKQARVAQIEGDPGSISVDKLLQVLHAIGASLLIEADTASQPLGADAGAAPEQRGASSLEPPPARGLNLIGARRRQDEAAKAHLPSGGATPSSRIAKTPPEKVPRKRKA